MRVALTFDDGPSQWTDPILDILAAHDAHATFFLVGANIGGREETIWRMLDEGHEIGNHTYNHPRLTGLSNLDVWNELERTSDLIDDVADMKPTIWRAPHLATDGRVNEIGAALGLTHIGATVDTSDWRATKNAVVANMRKAQDGAVVLLHDGMPPDGGGGSPTREATVQALSEAMVAVDAAFVALSGLVVSV